MSALELTMMKRIGELKAELTDCKAEVDRLKAENARLRAASFVTAVPVEQYERLRKAGDAMQKRLYVLENPTHHEVYLKLLSDWNAAKEGKPSV